VNNRERCCVLVVVLAAVAGCSACRETFEEHYPTLREAEQAGAISRGWIPSWIPSSARDIAEIHNIDSSAQLLTFSFDVYATASFLDACAPVERTRVIQPRWTAAKWWPAELRGSSAAPLGRLKFFFCESPEPSHRYFVGIDEAAGRAFMWNSPASP
jgi:hypothetical protein